MALGLRENFASTSMDAKILSVLTYGCSSALAGHVTTHKPQALHERRSKVIFFLSLLHLRALYGHTFRHNPHKEHRSLLISTAAWLSVLFATLINRKILTKVSFTSSSTSRYPFGPVTVPTAKTPLGKDSGYMNPSLARLKSKIALNSLMSSVGLRPQFTMTKSASK